MTMREVRQTSRFKKDYKAAVKRGLPKDELRAVIERTQLQLRRLEQHRRDLGRIDTLLYRCEISDSPEFIRFISSKGARYGFYFHCMPVGNNAVPELMPTVEQRKKMIIDNY